jgi:hypothetical protein
MYLHRSSQLCNFVVINKTFHVGKYLELIRELFIKLNMFFPMEKSDLDACKAR